MSGVALAARRAPARPHARPGAGTAVVRIPVGPARARRIALWGVAVLLLAVLAGTLVALGVPGRIADALLATSVRAGFEVKDVRVTGLHHMSAEPVYAAATEGASSAMLATSPQAIRARLLALPWVADATVARRLPATLDIRIVERVPAALWQQHGRVTLIDAGGHPLTGIDVAPFARLPLVVGPNANLEYPSLVALLSTQHSLAPAVDAATWVGGRRWDLTMKSHETLALPEGYGEAEAALAAFARANAKEPLIGRGFARFDLRLPGKMVVRVNRAVDPKAALRGTAI